MAGASVLNQPQNFLTPNEGLQKFPALDFNPKEQECISLIKKCNNIEEFKQVHCQILKLGFFWSSFCASNLLATCAHSEWGSMDYACSIFHQIDDPCSFDFNVMIRGYIKDINSEEALFTYLEMLEIGIEPDKFTYPALLKAIAFLSGIEEGMQIHGHVIKLGLVEDVFVQNSLINMYGKCGVLSHACSVFKQIDQKTNASWSAVIAAQANLGMWGECLRLFQRMNREGRCRAGESTLVNVLSACSHLGALHLGRGTHGYLVRNLSGMNVAVETSLVDMYIRCGRLDLGMCLFQKMEEKNRKSYSVVISGLACHGRGEGAQSVFEQMLEDGLRPDDVVYVGVLSACSRSGLVEEGVKYFDRMRNEHGIEPTIQHYGCMVDLMGRGGMVNEAYDLIKTMPMEPNDVVWRSLLSACKVHHHVELGEVAFENLIKLNTQNGGDYLMVSNMYAQVKRWDDVSLTRVKMARSGLGQTLGSCSVEVGRKVHKFVSNDMFHPQCGEIHEMIRQMEWQLKFEGYSPDTSHVLLDVDEEEKRERLRYHSQKLAIAFSLIGTCEGSPITIVRNVRMCGDCHKYTKLISVIYEREITIRDRNVFHHFRDGTCSRKDYW